MVEATEELVKVYLEQNGYLVTTSKRVNAWTSHYTPRAEIDVIAVKMGEDPINKLPLRIVGEVKSYHVDQRGFEELDKELRRKHGYSSRPEYSRYKWVNNKEYRKEILDCLNEEYGYPDFKFVIFLLRDKI